jgi:hypothetical protein
LHLTTGVEELTTKGTNGLHKEHQGVCTRHHELNAVDLEEELTTKGTRFTRIFEYMTCGVYLTTRGRG